MKIITKLDIIGKGPNSKIIKEYKAQFPKLSQDQKDILVGLILGDVYIFSRNDKKTYGVKFEWKLESKEYIYHVFSIFYNYILQEPKICSRINVNGNIVETWRMEAMIHVAFKELGDLFIINGKKNNY